jgi:ferredoxin
MTYIVTSACVKCKYTDCIEECPVDAFREGKYMLYIDPEICIDCNACVPACPVEAIYADDKIPDEENDYIEINANMCLDYDDTKVPVLGIGQSKDPLPTARKLEEVKANPLEKSLALKLAIETLDS